MFCHFDKTLHTAEGRTIITNGKTLLFPGGVYHACGNAIIDEGYTTLLFPGGVYQAQVFSSPKVLVATSHITNQPTEYSCFHDDHASPQALIPAIPSVLVFYFLGNVCNHCTLYLLGIGHFRRASARRLCADLRTARPVPAPRHALLPVLRWRYLHPPACVQPSPPYTLSYR